MRTLTHIVNSVSHGEVACGGILIPLQHPTDPSVGGQEKLVTAPRRHRFTVGEYRQVAEKGLVRGARVELIDGAIFDMTPQGAWHVECVRLLSEALIRGTRVGERVYIQSTTHLSRWSAPEPDIVVTRARPDAWTLPDARDIVLIIEVADRTLAYDLGTKVPLYERHGIPEVWVVELEGRQVHVFRMQEGEREYSPAQIVRSPAELQACGISLEVGALFP
jgi:Uma2 family endonuclease